MLTKLMIIVVINCFVIIINFRNHFDKALTEIFQFCRALYLTTCVDSRFSDFYPKETQKSWILKLAKKIQIWRFIFGNRIETRFSRNPFFILEIFFGNKKQKLHLKEFFFWKNVCFSHLYVWTRWFWWLDQSTKIILI